MNSKLKSFLEILLIIIIFITISYAVQTNLPFFEKLLQNNVLGKLIFVLLTITAIVFPPITVFPFIIPIASNVFGWIETTFLSVSAWTIGSIIAFLLSRIYGINLIKKLIPLNQITKFEKKLPEENVFWTLIFLRMSIPVDILSYALGLFSKINFKTFLVTTIIGVTPVILVFAYAGTLPIIYQIITLLIALIIITSGLIFKNRKSPNKKLTKSSN